MSSEKIYKFDSNVNALKQTVIANHLINAAKKQAKTSFEICPYTLANSLSLLTLRYAKTAIDIIIEYDLVNPQVVITMGNKETPPYAGVYNQNESKIIFDLNNFPPTLIVILYQFSLLITNEQHHSSSIKDRIRNNNLIFELKEIDYKSSLKRVTPIEAIMHAPGKISHDIVMPGKAVSTNKSGGTTRFLTRGHYCNADGNPYNRESGKPCWWDRHSFDGKAIGIPIKAVRVDGNLKIYMDGIFCSYECAYSYLCNELKISYAYRDHIYSNSLELIRQMYDEEFPGKVLKGAGDWKQLKDVGNGELSIRDFSQKLSSYCMGVNPNYSVEPVIRYTDLMKK